MNSFFRKLRWWTQRATKEAELREELQFHLEQEANCVEVAVSAVLAQGCRTKDLARASEPVLSTGEMGARVVAAVQVGARKTA